MGTPESIASMGYVKQPTVSDVAMSDNGTTARFLLPGMSPEYIDRAGNLAIWKISKLFETARVTAVLNPDFVFQKVVTGSNKSAFIILVNMELDKSLYRKARKDGWTWPMILSTSLVGFGKTSVDYISFIEDPTNSTKLGTLKFKYATVNLQTRKSMVIPEASKEPYKKYYKPELGVSGYKPDAVPTRAESLKVVIKPSDLDRNGHLNNCMYLKLCVDCAANASFDEAFRSFKGDIAYYNVKKLSALYQSECRLGESLEVFCWEDRDTDLVLHFQILKENKKPSFSCKMEFYPSMKSML